MRAGIRYSCLGLSEDESCKQRKSGYGDRDFSVGPSMELARPESHHDIGRGLQVITENGRPSDIFCGSPPRASFLMNSASTEKAAAADDEFIAALKRTRAFDSLIGNSGTMVSSSTSGLMNAQRISGSPKYAEALQFCTEGLGFESSDETDSTASSPRIESCKPEKLSTDIDGEHFDGGAEVNHNNKKNLITNRAPRATVKNFPPPLPSIARNGQPGVMMKSYKRDGRFVLQEFKVPSHEVLHAWRGEGRLKLQLVQQDHHTLFKCVNPDSDNTIYSKISGETVDNDQPAEEE